MNAIIKKSLVDQIETNLVSNQQEFVFQTDGTNTVFLETMQKLLQQLKTFRETNAILQKSIISLEARQITEKEIIEKEQQKISVALEELVKILKPRTQEETKVNEQLCQEQFVQIAQPIIQQTSTAPIAQKILDLLPTN